jgi:cytochrome P450
VTAPTGNAATASAAVAASASPFGLIDLVRRVRDDQLTAIAPDSYGQDLTYNRLLFLDSFRVNKPEYIEHVLLTNHANYRKSHFHRHLLRPLLGDGLLTSEGEFWRRQRRIAAPSFHSRRIGEFVATMAACTETMLMHWGALNGTFDLAAEMRALTLAIIARTMFSTEVDRDVETVGRLTDIVVNLRPGLLDLFGFPQWVPRYHPRSWRATIATFEGPGGAVPRREAERAVRSWRPSFDAARRARSRYRRRHERPAAPP